MYARVLIDGHSYDKEEIATVLVELLPTEPNFDTYYKAWCFLDRRRESSK